MGLKVEGGLWYVTRASKQKQIRHCATPYDVTTTVGNEHDVTRPGPMANCKNASAAFLQTTGGETATHIYGTSRALANRSKFDIARRYVTSPQSSEVNMTSLSLALWPTVLERVCCFSPNNWGRNCYAYLWYVTSASEQKQMRHRATSYDVTTTVGNEHDVIRPGPMANCKSASAAFLTTTGGETVMHIYGTSRGAANRSKFVIARRHVTSPQPSEANMSPLSLALWRTV